MRRYTLYNQLMAVAAGSLPLLALRSLRRRPGGAISPTTTRTVVS